MHTTLAIDVAAPTMEEKWRVRQQEAATTLTPLSLFVRFVSEAPVPRFVYLLRPFPLDVYADSA